MLEIFNNLERRDIVYTADNPHIIKPPRPNKPPKHPNQQCHENYQQNEENNNIQDSIVMKYQEKIRMQAKKIMTLEKRLYVIERQSNSDNKKKSDEDSEELIKEAHQEIERLSEENGALKNMLSNVENDKNRSSNSFVL